MVLEGGTNYVREKGIEIRRTGNRSYGRGKRRKAGSGTLPECRKKEGRENLHLRDDSSVLHRDSAVQEKRRGPPRDPKKSFASYSKKGGGKARECFLGGGGGEFTIIKECRPTPPVEGKHFLQQEGREAIKGRGQTIWPEKFSFP